MLVSAEIRWFWHSSPPLTLPKWFRGEGEFANSHPCEAGGGQPRKDGYLRDSSQAELGIKSRGGKKGVEIKGLVTVLWDGISAGPFSGPVEIWTKWTSESLVLDPGQLIFTTKVRYLRKFDTAFAEPAEIPIGPDEKPVDPKRCLPSLGCNVELTEVTVDSETWWTLGFEAFGKPETVAKDLCAVAHTLAARNVPDLQPALRASYPVWLRHLIQGVRPKA